MKRGLLFTMVVASLVLLGPEGASAEQRLASSYDLGEGYALKLGSKAAELHHSRNIVGLKKSDVASGDDSLILTLTKPEYDFGGDSVSLGLVYTRPLKEDVTSSLSLTGGAADSGGAQDVAMMFHIRIKLQ